VIPFVFGVWVFMSVFGVIFIIFYDYLQVEREIFFKERGAFSREYRTYHSNG